MEKFSNEHHCSDKLIPGALSTRQNWMHEVALQHTPKATDANHHMPHNEVVGSDGFTISFERADIIPMKLDPNVSQKFKQRVEQWINSIPPQIARQAASHGVNLQVVATSDQIPAHIRDLHVRRYNEMQRTYGQVPAFYNAGAKRIYFIENPTMTPQEQQLQQICDHAKQELSARGVQDLQEFKVQQLSFAPFERIAWHELGHALDLAVLGSYSLSSEKFGNAFMKAKAKMTPEQLSTFYYYTRAVENAYRGHEFDAAQQETFAQLFALMHCPKWQRDPDADRLQLIFAAALNAMRDENPTLFGYESNAHPNKRQ